MRIVLAIAKGALEARIVSLGEMAGFGRLAWRDDKMPTFHSVPNDYTPVKDRNFACSSSNNDNDPWARLRGATEAQRAQRPMRLPTNAGN
jgi:hypothetical protein